MESCINVKRIVLYVSEDAKIPDILQDLSPEETEMVISIGCLSLAESKKRLANITSREIAKELEQEITDKFRETTESMQHQISQSEKDIHFQKELIRLMKEDQEIQINKRISQTKDVYDTMLESYRKDRESLREKVAELEKECDKSREVSRNKSIELDTKVHAEAMQLVKHELDSMTKILTEKEKQIETYKDLFERSMQKVDGLTQKRDVASIGKIGEGMFKELALSTFRDFDGFQVKDVYSMGGLGDFHLQFKEMTILVDSKLYSNKVNSTSRAKIKRDLLNNDHIQFAWLVSIDTYVDRFDKAPFMFEWVNANKCVCYINCLQKQEDPGEILRSVWYCCKIIQKMMTNEGSEKGELGILKEKEMKMRDVLSQLAKTNRERDTMITQLRGNFEKADAYIRELLNEETNTITACYSVVIEWWNRTMEESDNATEKIKSTAVWNQFKKDMGDKLGDIDCNSFKEVLCSLLSENKVIKGKTKGGAFEIVGYIQREKDENPLM
jgi:hypothetical protein